MYCIIIAATIPTLRPLFLWATSASFRSSQQRNTYQAYDNGTFVLSHLSSHSDRKGNKHVVAHASRKEADSDRKYLHPGDIQRITDIDVVYDEASTRTDNAMGWSLPDSDRKSVHVEDSV